MKYPGNIRMDRVAEGAALPNVSLPQWTPDRSIEEKRVDNFAQFIRIRKKNFRASFQTGGMAGNGLKAGFPRRTHTQWKRLSNITC